MAVVNVGGSDTGTGRDQAVSRNRTPHSSDFGRATEQASVRKYVGGVWQWPYGQPYTAERTRVVWNRDTYTTHELAGDVDTDG